jgi:hypothetical protein
MAVEDLIQLNHDDDDDDDDDNENVISLNKIKAELSQPSFMDDIDKLNHAGEKNLGRWYVLDSCLLGLCTMWL